MAIIERQISTGGSITGWDIPDLCPAGAHVAVCLDIKDTYDVTRPKYEDPSQNEVVNLTRFLFGINGQNGACHRVQTHDLKISGHEKSSLVNILMNWLAKPHDDLIGWDYIEQIGKPAMLTVIHKTSQKGTVYAIIQGITPVVDQLLPQVPNPTLFEGAAESIATPVEPTQEVKPVAGTTADDAKTETKTVTDSNPFEVGEGGVPF